MPIRQTEGLLVRFDDGTSELRWPESGCYQGFDALGRRPEQVEAYAVVPGADGRDEWLFCGHTIRALESRRGCPLVWVWRITGGLGKDEPLVGRWERAQVETYPEQVKRLQVDGDRAESVLRSTATALAVRLRDARDKAKQCEAALRAAGEDVPWRGHTAAWERLCNAIGCLRGWPDEDIREVVDAFDAVNPVRRYVTPTTTVDVDGLSAIVAEKAAQHAPDVIGQALTVASGAQAIAEAKAKRAAEVREPTPMREEPIDAEDLWTDYRTERPHLTASDRLAFLEGVAAARRTATPPRAMREPLPLPPTLNAGTA